MRRRKQVICGEHNADYGFVLKIPTSAWTSCLLAPKTFLSPMGQNLKAKMDACTVPTCDGSPNGSFSATPRSTLQGRLSGTTYLSNSACLPELTPWEANPRLDINRGGFAGDSTPMTGTQFLDHDPLQQTSCRVITRRAILAASTCSGH